MRRLLVGIAIKVGHFVATFLLIQLGLRLTNRPHVYIREQAWGPIKELLPHLPHRPLDNLYRVPTWEQFNRIVKWDWLDKRPYEAEFFDCDDFAFAFAARMRVLFGLNNVGVVYDDSSVHSYNVVLVRDGGEVIAMLYEPQDDSFPLPGTRSHKALAGQVLF